MKRAFTRQSHHALARANAKTAAVELISGRGSLETFRLGWRLAFAKRDWNWYASLFPSRPGLMCGEICPGYARLSPEVIQSIAERNPRVKIIYLLRDPIDRAWSSVAMHFRKRNDQTINEVERDQILNRIGQPKFQSHCRYEENIANWLGRFPADQVYFGFFERIEAEPMEYLADILAFLGLPPQPAASAPSKRINAGKGEMIDPTIEKRLGTLLREEAARAHDRFGNASTAKWLAHAQAVTA